MNIHKRVNIKKKEWLHLHFHKSRSTCTSLNHLSLYLHNSLSIIQREQMTPNWGSSTEHIQDFTSYHQVMRTVDAGKISSMPSIINKTLILGRWQKFSIRTFLPSDKIEPANWQFFRQKVRIAVHCNKNTTLLKTSAKKHVRSVWRPKISHFCMRKFFSTWEGVIFCIDLFF